MTSIPALLLQASREIREGKERDEAHLNSALASAAYKMGFKLGEANSAVLVDELRDLAARPTKRL